MFGTASSISYNEHISIKYGKKIEMQGGPLIQRNAVNAMYHILEKALDKSERTLKDLTYVLPHQANLRIMNVLEDKIQDKHKHIKLIKTIDQMGNTSSATIPIALDFYLKNKLAYTPYQQSKAIGFTSVGGGYTFSSAIIEI